jgi:hypothetical protein
MPKNPNHYFLNIALNTAAGVDIADTNTRDVLVVKLDSGKLVTASRRRTPSVVYNASAMKLCDPPQRQAD